MIIYADDTILYCDLNPGAPKFVNIINGKLGNVLKWLSANKLSLNVNKTKVIDSFIFSGLLINHSLSWNNHIRSISSKISKIAGILHKLKK